MHKFEFVDFLLGEYVHRVIRRLVHYRPHFGGGVNRGCVVKRFRFLISECVTLPPALSVDPLEKIVPLLKHQVTMFLEPPCRLGMLEQGILRAYTWSHTFDIAATLALPTLKVCRLLSSIEIPFTDIGVP